MKLRHALSELACVGARAFGLCGCRLNRETTAGSIAVLTCAWLLRLRFVSRMAPAYARGPAWSYSEVARNLFDAPLVLLA